MAMAIHSLCSCRCKQGLVWLLVFPTIVALPIAGPGSVDLTLLVRSQDTEIDRARLAELRATIAEAGWPHKTVVSMSDAERDLKHRGLWTYKPWIFLLEDALQKARRRSAGGQRWLVFIEPSTAVNPSALQALLSSYDARTQLFLGRKLVDTEPCIIHHYSQAPPYPHVHAGFAISGSLARALVRDVKENSLPIEQQIEPVWELAKWIEKLGVAITDRDDAFCVEEQASCSTWVRQSNPQHYGSTVKPNDVLIAVKTVGHFHSSRIPVIHELWAASSPVDVLYLSNEAYHTGVHSDVLQKLVVNLSPEFGDAVDPSKESSKTGSGHCAKMRAILQYLQKHQVGRHWYVVSDDDTLLNIPRLLEVLGLHDHTKPIYLGERYGWAHTEVAEGTNYMTTGAGMAISAPALAEVLKCKQCSCPRPDSPDDMMLGAWFSGLPVQMIHEESFHQAEPQNYHPDILRHAAQPLSFHRFNVRLPEKTPQSKIMKARKKNWREWQREHFNRKNANPEL